jgi:catechol 2,3-dioxygenase-like lactoylglutathione lyase family enzyme
MFSHVVVGSNDIDRSKKFYDALFGKEAFVDDKGRLAYRKDGAAFMVTKPLNGEEACFANGGTIGFKCQSPEQVRQFHDVAVAHGGTSVEDPPGLREGGMGPLHLAYVRDPDGHKLCALHRGT